jgi:hypothetical protein
VLTRSARAPTQRASAAKPHRLHRRLGLRPEKCASGADLTTPAPAGVIREPVHNRLGTQLMPAIVAKRRLRGPQRLQRIFRADTAVWPHRAVEPMWLHRGRPLGTLLLAVADVRSPAVARAVAVLAGRGPWSGATRRGAVPRRCADGAAGKRTERFVAASSVHVIRVASHDHRRTCAPGMCRTKASLTRRGVERSESTSAGRFPARGSGTRTDSAGAALQRQLLPTDWRVSC